MSTSSYPDMSLESVYLRMISLHATMNEPNTRTGVLPQVNSKRNAGPSPQAVTLGGKAPGVVAPREVAPATGKNRSKPPPAEWSCGSCTLLNSMTSWRCVLCGRDRVPLVDTREAADISMQTENQCHVSPVASSTRQEDGDDGVVGTEVVGKKRARRGEGKKGPDSAVDLTLSKKKVAIMTTEAESASVEMYVKGASADGNDFSGVSMEGCSEAVTTVVCKEYSSSLGAVSTRGGSESPVLLTDDEIDDMFGLREESHLYCPPVVAIVGRRLGNLRAGKNRLVGE